MFYTTPTLELLERAVGVAALRQSVYASNIANAGVEGYRRLEVALQSELGGTDPQVAASLPDAAPTVLPTNSAVRLDEEMALMARNALRHQILLDAFERSLGSVKLAMEEGR